MIYGKPKCTYKNDCRGCRGDICSSLSDTDFKGKPCPFYKTNEQFEAEEAAGLERMKAIKRYDLIRRYRNNG